MAIISGDAAKRRYRIGLYGDPKFGKTRLVTALPWGDVWGEAAGYIASDLDAESLDSVLIHNRSHLYVDKPGPTLVGNRLVDDPHKAIIKCATRPWHLGFKETLPDGTTVDVPPCGTVIWDTATTTARELLGAYADTGVFSSDKGDKHVAVGDFGKADYMANPMMGDYGVAQRAIMKALGFLFKLPVNLIVVFHTEYDEPEGGTPTFGPGTVGKAGIRTVAGAFPNLFRIGVKDVQDPKDKMKTIPRYTVFTQKKGYYLAGLRSPHATNPMPEVVLKDDPSHFWTQLHETLSVKETK